MIEDNENYQLILKTFPKIAGELKALWGTPKFFTYLESLEQDTTGTPRAGFPEGVLEALLKIDEEHDTKFPEFKPKSKWIS
jgi:hypothetical protein